MASKPAESIPAACAAPVETVAVYRLLAHEQVTWHEGLLSHAEAAMPRMGREEAVPCLQDTTELDYKGRAMRGLGPLS